MSSKKNRGQSRPHPHTSPARPTATDVTEPRPALLEPEPQVTDADQQRAEATGKPLTVTVRGIDVALDPEALSSWEFLEAVTLSQSGDMTAFYSVVTSLLGDSRDKVLDTLRDPDTGRVPLDAVGAVMTELLEAANLGN
ncbi:hypothetical protein CWT12_06435 [Actinomyces sp. 432]|uniref:hypothetical protein n=1 Tax=Actinomyces sp. 432 TaxID=2057798 RepID=UPI001373F386|nr:hypothetical protein [Actinomyces sp. 432]QHO91025.1 hypothetical protein CWT12_06435 [Actinomyces sp. 432]